jgi:hypothetical protein
MSEDESSEISSDREVEETDNQNDISQDGLVWKLRSVRSARSCQQCQELQEDCGLKGAALQAMHLLS